MRKRRSNGRLRSTPIWRAAGHQRLGQIYLGNPALAVEQLAARLAPEPFRSVAYGRRPWRMRTFFARQISRKPGLGERVAPATARDCAGHIGAAAALALAGPLDEAHEAREPAICEPIRLERCASPTSDMLGPSDGRSTSTVRSRACASRGFPNDRAAPPRRDPRGRRRRLLEARRQRRGRNVGPLRALRTDIIEPAIGKHAGRLFKQWATASWSSSPVPCRR